jgi:hypothetical protein
LVGEVMVQGDPVRVSKGFQLQGFQLAPCGVQSRARVQQRQHVQQHRLCRPHGIVRGGLTGFLSNRSQSRRLLWSSDVWAVGGVCPRHQRVGVSHHRRFTQSTAHAPAGVVKWVWRTRGGSKGGIGKWVRRRIDVRAQRTCRITTVARIVRALHAARTREADVERGESAGGPRTTQTSSNSSRRSGRGRGGGTAALMPPLACRAPAAARGPTRRRRLGFSQTAECSARKASL